MPAKTPELDLEELGAQYGWAMAVLDAIPEVRSLFKIYVRENWTEAKLQAKIRETKWYRTKSESQRSGAILKLTDPAEFNRRAESMYIHAQNVYRKMAGGHGKSSAYFTAMAGQAMLLGWTDEELENAIGKSINYNALLNQQRLGGEAGQTEDFVRKAAADYGVKVSGEWLTQRIKNNVQGIEDENSIMHSIRQMAKSRYRGFSEQFDQGLTLRDIAEPYRQSYAQLLEVNPNDVDLMDGQIQKALTRSNPDSQKPEPMAVWEFENQLRDDPRWMETNNAREGMLSVGRNILTQMGLSV